MSPWYQPVLKRLQSDFPEFFVADPVAVVRIDEQRLYLIRQGQIQREYPISTSRHGIGNQDGSFRTPLGVHRIHSKFGDGAPKGTVFRARENTGKVAPIVTVPERTPGDFITTRILWLEGLEDGVNRGEGIDSFSRYIYIHGTDEEGLIGQPASEGCVRMTNADVIELFETMPEGTLVVIQSSP
ncbi:L,D-transpeptidase [Ectothiorhodospira sp. BSL-9]|uniref:L,D-transpeptidase n=1 Tax=Ectothiorhodospira sp. BSL-9 TaxID=1442136 RepID=UPI0007B43570|nr:L,D-transpeptidase [Ectothiorhodospira sp. BSL-9]ANB03826.1 ErfK/YbiS/YcfS/YnhG family protein [Ectothiorhodospira sp. BSL-9]TVQ69448.1 MAG: L,D-transpeptidase [Chromatiaceae bacterium]